MDECWIIYNFKTGKIYSASEFMWSHCVGTFFPTKEDAYKTIEKDSLDRQHVGTIHLFNS